MQWQARQAAIPLLQPLAQGYISQMTKAHLVQTSQLVPLALALSLRFYRSPTKHPGVVQSLPSLVMMDVSVCDPWVQRVYHRIRQSLDPFRLRGAWK